MDAYLKFSLLLILEKNFFALLKCVINVYFSTEEEYAYRHCLLEGNVPNIITTFLHLSGKIVERKLFFEN